MKNISKYMVYSLAAVSLALTIIASPSAKAFWSSSDQDVFANLAASSFFGRIDATYRSPSTQNRMVAERFYRLMSRLSVFSLYCDPRNQMGYPTKFSELWQASTNLQTIAEREFGGQQAAYNKFEGQRNEESLRMARSNTAEVCASDDSRLKSIVRQSPAQIEAGLRNTPLGQM